MGFPRKVAGVLVGGPLGTKGSGFLLSCLPRWPHHSAFLLWTWKIFTHTYLKRGASGHLYPLLYYVLLRTCELATGHHHLVHPTKDSTFDGTFQKQQLRNVSGMSTCPLITCIMGGKINDFRVRQTQVSILLCHVMALD